MNPLMIGLIAASIGAVLFLGLFVWAYVYRSPDMANCKVWNPKKLMETTKCKTLTDGTAVAESTTDDG